MDLLKKVLLFIATTSLSLFIFISASLWILNHTILRPTLIKKWANDSGLYANIIPAIADVIDNPSTDSTVPFKNSEILEAGKSAFNDKVLRSATEQTIDQVTSWLEGNTDNLELNINVTEARTSFANQIGAIATARLAALPICSAKTPALSFDVFSVTCLPKNVSPSVQGNNLANELIANKSFFGDGTITNKTIGLTDQHQKTTAFMPSIYGLKNMVFYISVLLVVIFTLIVIFISIDKRRGITKVAGVYMFVAVALLSTAALIPFLTKALAPASNSTSDKAFVDKIAKPLIDQISKSMIEQHVLTGLVIGGIGLVFVLYLLITRYSKKPTSIATASDRPFSDDVAAEPAEQTTDTDVQNLT